MTDIDWIQLWLLNRTVSMRCRTSLLIRLVTKEHFGLWNFPERIAIQANEEDRIQALRHCVEKGLIEVYPDSWLQDNQFRGSGSLSLAQCDFDDQQFQD